MDDRQLLDDFVTSGSESAFREIVRRHINLVYATCRRRLKDRHLAEDATQAVFIVLARRAGSISRSTPLVGWLYRTARYVSYNAVRIEAIRRRFEMSAAKAGGGGSGRSVVAGEMASAGNPGQAQVDIDDALERLRPEERDALLLHYIEGRSHREVGNVLRISEEAARKRVSRALERLRDVLRPAAGTALSGTAVAQALASAAEAAPASLVSVAASAALSAGGASAGAISLAKGAILMATATQTKATAAAGATVIVLMLGGSAALLITHLAAPNNPPRPTMMLAKPASRAISAPASTASMPPFQHHHPSYASFPYAKGFPIAVPGSITGSPALADLDGDGQWEIAVPVIGRNIYDNDRYEPAVHPAPSMEGRIYAFRGDGSSFPNFPIVIRGLEERRARPRMDWWWNFGPSVTDTDGNGTEELIVGGSVLYGDGVHLRYRDNFDPYASSVIADVDADGQLDMVMGWTAQSVRGGRIRGWSRDRSFHGGYSPAIGDADGDGDLEIFHPHGEWARGFAAYDHELRLLPGWPKPLKHRIMYPVIGDMDGDGKAEVLGVDEAGMYTGNRLHAWHLDGRPLKACRQVDGLDSIFKTDLYAFFTHPALADLDGDGAAEILILDWNTRTVRAWKADGSAAVPHDPALPDGHLVTLPPQKHSGYGAGGGIAVGDLGADGVIDLFVGTSWFQLQRSSSPRRIDMAPGQPQITATPTIVDLNKDGLADIVFGTTDGRLFVYHTKMTYQQPLVQWATQEGNFRRTSHWRRST